MKTNTRDPANEQLRLGIIAGMVTYLFWGALTVFWKGLHHFDAFELIAWRIALSAVLMAVVLTVTKRWAKLRPVVASRALLLRVAAAAVLLTANWTAYVWAVVHDHVIETALGYFIAPLGTMMVGVVVLHERLHRVQWIAIGFAVAAVGVLTYSYGRVPWLALIIAVSWTIYGYMKKQVPLHPIESMAAESFLLAIPAAVLMIVVASHVHSIPSSATGGQWVLVSLTGLVTITPLMLFAFAAQRVPLTILGPMQYSVPTINFLLGWLAYGESLPPSRIVGFTLVWIGLALLTFHSARRIRAARIQLEPAVA